MKDHNFKNHPDFGCVDSLIGIFVDTHSYGAFHAGEMTYF